MSDKNNDEFYVGYLPKAPKSFGKQSLIATIFIAVLLVIGAFIIVKNQTGFSKSQFEFGNLTELTGVVSKTPVPNIKIITGNDTSGNIIYQTIPLINFGKFGADSLVNLFEKKSEKPLSKTVMTLKGTLIYGDGKTLLELTEMEKALVKTSYDLSEYPNVEQTTVKLGEQTLRGEVIDPKCYFGVMKPGHGKPHKSCAIRCISGGIPPVYWTQDADGNTEYYLIRSDDTQDINRNILVYVGDQTEMTGEVVQIDDWKVIYVSAEYGINRL